LDPSNVEETDPVLINSPGLGRDEKRAERIERIGSREVKEAERERRQQWTGQSRKEYDRNKSRNFTFNNETSQRKPSEKKPANLLPSLADVNQSNIVTKPDSYLDDNLLRKEKMTSDADNITTENQMNDNDSQHIVLTTQGPRDTTNPLLTEPTPELKPTRSRELEQRMKLGPVPIVHRNTRARPLGKNDVGGKSSISNDEFSQIMGDVSKKPNEQASVSDARSFHMRSRSNYGAKDNSNVEDNNNHGRTARDRSEGEEKKYDPYRQLMSPVESHRSDKNLLKAGSRVLEIRESESYARQNSPHRYHTNTSARGTTLTEGMTYRDMQASDISILKLHYSKSPPEKKISIKVREITMNNESEIIIESEDRENPENNAINMEDILVLEKEANQNRKKNSKNLKEKDVL